MYSRTFMYLICYLTFLRWESSDGIGWKFGP